MAGWWAQQKTLALLLSFIFSIAAVHHRGKTQRQTRKGQANEEGSDGIPELRAAAKVCVLQRPGVEAAALGRDVALNFKAL